MEASAFRTRKANRVITVVPVVLTSTTYPPTCGRPSFCCSRSLARLLVPISTSASPLESTDRGRFDYTLATPRSVLGELSGAESRHTGDIYDAVSQCVATVSTLEVVGADEAP